MNLVLLRGTLSSAPTERVLPSGSRLASYEVTTPSPHGPAESVPVVWFDPPPAAARLVAGAEVVVAGRVRRRFFRSGGATASRTEVVASSVLSATQRRRVSRLIEAVAGEAAGLGREPAGG